jgi:hypothetical protein
MFCIILYTMEKLAQLVNELDIDGKFYSFFFYFFFLKVILNIFFFFRRIRLSCPLFFSQWLY